MKPAPPPAPEKPPVSWLRFALALLAGGTALSLLTMLTLGYLGPMLVLGAGLLLVIGLQYAAWGWWMERVYRRPPEENDEPHPADNPRPWER